MQHWFAPVIGHDSTAVSASATVGWGAPSRGTAVMPMTFSWCEFSQQTGGGLPSGSVARTIYFTKTSNTTGCTGPSHNIVPGGFAYLNTDPGKCAASTGLGGQWMSSTGNSVPSPCSTADFAKWVGQTVLLPIFDQSGDTGSNAWYRVYGYAAFKLTGYSLGGEYSTSPKPCSGNDRCVSGYFTRFVELSDAWNYSPDAPTLGPPSSDSSDKGRRTVMRRLLAAFAALLLLVVGSVVLLAYVHGADTRALAGVRTVEVLVADERIPEGTSGDALDGAGAHRDRAHQDRGPRPGRRPLLPVRPGRHHRPAAG